MTSACVSHCIECSCAMAHKTQKYTIGRIALCRCGIRGSIRKSSHCLLCRRDAPDYTSLQWCNQHNANGCNQIRRYGRRSKNVSTSLWRCNKNAQMTVFHSWLLVDEPRFWHLHFWLPVDEPQIWRQHFWLPVDELQFGVHTVDCRTLCLREDDYTLNCWSAIHKFDVNSVDYWSL